MNQLFVIVYAITGNMLGRRAYKTQKAAEAYLAHFNSGTTAKRDGKAKYQIERYLPAPLKHADEGSK